MDSSYQALAPHLGPGHHAAIIIRPDPDSLASACALRLLFKKHQSESTSIIYEPIKRLENRTMVKLLKIPLKSIKEVNLADFDRFCIVDGQPNQFPQAKVPGWNIVIDHHPVVEGHNYDYVDIRPEIGATSTIMTQYMNQACIRIGERLATSLCYGIITDTDNFQRDMTHDDALAFSSLFPHINYKLLKMIDQIEIPLKQLHFFDMALHRLRVHARRAVVHLGPAESADIAVIIADFFIRVSGIQFVAISCIVDENLIIIFRSRGMRKDAGKAAKLHFDELGMAGGHQAAARAEIPVATMRSMIKLYDPDQVEDFIRKRLSRKGQGRGK